METSLKQLLTSSPEKAVKLIKAFFMQLKTAGDKPGNKARKAVKLIKAFFMQLNKAGEWGQG